MRRGPQRDVHKKLNKNKYLKYFPCVQPPGIFFPLSCPDTVILHRQTVDWYAVLGVR